MLISSNPITRRLLAFRLRRARLTYLDHKALEDLHRAVVDNEEKKIQGVIIEAGCALGGSAIMMASAKEQGRKMYVLDVFDMIPPPSERDGEDVLQRYEVIKSGGSRGIAGDEYYGYRKDLKQEVEGSFNRFGIELVDHDIHLVEGLFEETLPSIQEPVSLAHIDGDWYESVSCCLNEIAPRLSLGGRMVIDDYDAWSGCRTAVDEFLESNDGAFRIERNARLHLVRQR